MSTIAAYYTQYVDVLEDTLLEMWVWLRPIHQVDVDEFSRVHNCKDRINPTAMVNCELESLINQYYKANKEKYFCMTWELLKFETGKYLIKYGSDISKKTRANLTVHAQKTSRPAV